MESGKLDLNVKTKDCFVRLHRIDTEVVENATVVEGMDIPEDSDSIEDLPNLFSFSFTKKKVKYKKTTAELLEEHRNLAQNLKCDNEFNTTVEETTRRLQTVEIETPNEDRTSTTPDPVPFEEIEEKGFKIFCVNNSLQFFNSRDVTPRTCGYDNLCQDSFPVHIFEQKMLSFKRAEFEHVISSFLYSAKESCISDCKSFLTFLLKTLSVHRDMSCITACYRVLVSLLDGHPESARLTFSSAEVFMLLFNYGTDIESFKFLWSDIKNDLEVSQYQRNSEGIPDKWSFNFKYILKALSKLISSCNFKHKDIRRIVIFFMWISKDSTLIKEEHLYNLLCDTINTCLEKVKEEKWNKFQCDIVNTLMSLESATIPEKWATINVMVEAIPNKGIRAVKLRKLISFFSLKHMCLRSTEDLDESSTGFSLGELQSLIKLLANINSDLLNYAAKFVDICVKDLGSSKEEYSSLCDVLKHCEASLCETARNEKTNFLKIYAKLRLFCGQKISLPERASLVKVKSESDNPDFNENCNSSSHCDSEIVDKESISFTPNLSEDSQSCSTNQSYHTESSSSKDSTNNVYIKKESEDACDPGDTKRVGILIRKKRSSRSSSGNSLVDPSLTTIEEDDASRPSSEFECKLLNEDSRSRNTPIQNSTVDSTITGSSIVISDFSAEYTDICSSVKIEPQQYCDPVPVISEFVKMDVAGNEGTLPSVSENYINENIFEEDMTPLLEICEVKSIALSNIDFTESSSTVVSDYIYEANQQFSTEIPLNANNAIVSGIEIPVLSNESKLEIIAIEGGVLNESPKDLENINSVTLKQNITSTSSATSNQLEADEDIIFVKETISPNKLSKTDVKEDNIPSPIERYSKAHPELSITPVKDMPSSSVASKINLTNAEDIVIIEEKTPVKENADVIFLKVSPPSKVQSKLSPKKILPTDDNASQCHKMDVSDIIITKLNISPEIEISKSDVQPLGNNSDSDDIEILEDSQAVKLDEDKSSKNVSNPVINSDKSNINISFFEVESNSPQCKEVLTSVLKQIDSPNTFDSHCSDIQLQDQETLNTSKEIDLKNNSDSQCSDVLNSVLECVDVTAKLIYNDNVLVSNSYSINFKNEHLTLEEKNPHSIKKTTYKLENEADLTCDLISSNMTKSNLKLGLESLNKSNNTTIFPQNITDKTSTDKFLDKHLCSSSTCLQSTNMCSNICDENFKCDSGIKSVNFISNISNSKDNTSVQSSTNISVDLQDHNTDTISDIVNKSLKYVEDSLKAEVLDVSNTSRNSVHSPTTVNPLILKTEVAKETSVSPPQIKISESASCCNTVKSNSNTLDFIEIENQNENKLTAIKTIVPEAKQIFTSKINQSQSIISDCFDCPVSKESDSTVFEKTEVLEKVSTIDSNTKAKDYVLSSITSSSKSILKKVGKTNFADCVQNFRKPLANNILSVSNQNKICNSTNTKVLLDSLISSGSARKTVRNHKQNRVFKSKVAKKSFENKGEVEFIKMSPKKALLKRTCSNYINPSSRIQRKRTWSSLCENKELMKQPRKSPRKYSPVKSPLSSKYCVPKSPKKFFDYSIARQKIMCVRPSLLSKTGVNLTNILRERLVSSSGNNQQHSESDSDDSDIIELYTDPKRFADKECLVVYEHEDIVVLD